MGHVNVTPSGPRGYTVSSGASEVAAMFTPRLPRSLARSTRVACALVTLAGIFTAHPARAQEPGSGDGFLFRPPTGDVAVRAGFDLASAGSDIFTFVTSELTVNRRDFS